MADERSEQEIRNELCKLANREQRQDNGLDKLDSSMIERIRKWLCRHDWEYIPPYNHTTIIELLSKNGKTPCLAICRKCGKEIDGMLEERKVIKGILNMK